MTDPWAVSLLFRPVTPLSSFPSLNTLLSSLTLCQFIRSLLLYFNPAPHLSTALPLPLSIHQCFAASVPCSHRSLILLALVGDERGFCLPPAAVTWRHTRGDSQIEDGIAALCCVLPRKEFTACGRGEQTCLFVNENITSLFPSLFTVIFIYV